MKVLYLKEKKQAYRQMGRSRQTGTLGKKLGTGIHTGDPTSSWWKWLTNGVMRGLVSGAS